MEYLFSYGTLQDASVQVELFGRSLSGESDYLPGFRRDLIMIKDAAFLKTGASTDQLTAVCTNDANDRVDGTVFEVSNDELVIADGYEPDNYFRVKIKLGSGTEAWLYLAAHTG